MPDLSGLPLGTITVAALAIIAVACGLAWIIGSISGSRSKGTELDKQRRSSVNWATVKDVKPLRLKSPDPRRLRLCNVGAVGLCNPPLRSKLVIAPTGAGKTPRVVIPDVLLHEGPAVVTSVKGDVLALTKTARARKGPVWVFDPAESVGPTARWSPLSSIHTWADALDSARWIQESSKVEGSGGVSDRDFWDAQARFLLAPLLWFAAKHHLTMTAIAAMVTGNEDTEAELTAALAELCGRESEPGPMIYWSRFRGLESRTKSSVFITAATVLEGWTHPRVAQAVNVGADDHDNILDLDFVTTGQGTLYLVSPAAEQAEFTSIFETLVNAITMRVERAAQANGGLAIDPPLLLALDEAANIAPIRNLDALASKGAGEGIIVVSVWQDEGQILTRYGPAKARTILANHYAKIYLPGIQDHETLVHLSEQVGSDTMTQTSTTYGHGGKSTTNSEREYAVAPPSWLRQLDPKEVIVLAGRYKPILGVLPGWYEDNKLRKLIPADDAARFDAFHTGKSKQASHLTAITDRMKTLASKIKAEPENTVGSRS